MIGNYKKMDLDSTSEDGFSDINLNISEKMNHINKIIYNLDQYSNGYNFGQYYENNETNLNILRGGTVNEANDDLITITLKKYKKIKTFAKVAKNTIIKYRNLAQYYFESYNIVLFNYMALLQLLYKQKKALEDKMEDFEKLSRDYSNGVDKIKLLETMINGVEKVVKQTTNLDLEIKNKINGKEFNISADAKLTSVDKGDKGDKSVKILNETVNLAGGGLMHIMFGGEMDLYEFTNKLDEEIQSLNDYGKQLDADNEFIDKKIKSLHNRVEKIMGDTEELLNIRLSIEWMVNQLEKPTVIEEQEKAEAVDYQAIFDKLQTTIKEVKDKKINPEVAKYIRDLEGMAKYFEDFIIANKSTLSNIPEEQKKKMVETLKNIHGVSNNLFNDDTNSSKATNNEPGDEEYKDARQGDMFGGYGFNKYGLNKYGGGLQHEYDSINKNITNTINNKYNTSSLRVIFVGDENTKVPEMIKENEDINDINIIQGKLYQIYVMSEELDKIFNLMVQYVPTLSDINFQEYWNKLFENKNTDFYSKVKQYEIINVSNDPSDSKEIKANDFLNVVRNITDFSEYKFFIYYSIDSLDNIIRKLNHTIIFYHIFVFLMIDIKFFYLTFETREVQGFDLSKVKSLIELYDNLTKSNTFYKFNEYFTHLQESKKNNQFMEAVSQSVSQPGTEPGTKPNTESKLEGGLGQEQISSIYNVLSSEQITSITKPQGINENVLSDLYGKFNVSFSKVISKSNEIEDIKKFTGEIYKDVGRTIIKEDKVLTKSMKDLVQKISSILGKEIPPIQFVPKDVLDSMDVNKILELLGEKQNLIYNSSANLSANSSVNSSANSSVNSSANSSLEPKVGGAYERPRVSPYKQALEKCLQDLTPLYSNATKIERYIDKKAIPEENYGPNTQAFITLYSVLEDNLNKGTNSYINVNPMIFFTIEFPPSRYAKDECKFVFTFKNQQIQYNPPNPYCMTKLNSMYKFDIQEKPIQLETNQAFLKSVGNDTTQDLMTDRVIGLNKLIDAKPSLDSTIPTPTQKVINLMFALGASGTGKTTRYFGFSGATDAGDREGIVPGIVKKAKGTDGDKVQVEMGYFVCYGRKTEIGFRGPENSFSDNSNNKFNELVIFANIDKVNNKMKMNNYEFDNNDFYIFNESNNTSNYTSNYTSNNNSTYTNFYSNIVSKKLQKINYDSIKDYITNNGDFTPVKTDGFEACSFREIIQPIGDVNIEKYKNLWYKVNDTNELSELFENLIKAQKCIRTVLPTKNNIESSRGHTCVLIKIIKTNSDGINETQYFPLFDMAGTENVNAMNDFFTQGINEYKMNKLIGIVSELSKDNNINDNELGKDKKYFASLNEVLKNKSVQQYVNSQSGGKKQKSGQKGGKGTWNIDENGKQIERIENEIKYSSITGNNLIQKILGEGYYINHTIGMLIYIAKCIGCSINSPIIDGQDQFDNIQSDVVSQLMNYVNYYDGEGKLQGGGQTRILLNGIDFNTIVGGTTIWIQVLLSFLYWNEENKQTFDEIIKECVSGNIVNKVKYLAEQLDLNNVDPEAPGNIEKYSIFDDYELNPTYNNFFNNFYSISSGEINLNLNTLDAKVVELEEIYPIGTSNDDKYYILKVEGDNMTITNKTIKAYEAYINKGNKLSKEDFYNELYNVVNENSNSNDEKYSAVLSKIPVGLNDELPNGIICKNDQEGKSCRFNVKLYKEFYDKLGKKPKIAKRINELIIELMIKIIENKLNIKSKLKKNNDKYIIPEEMMFNEDLIYEKLFDYDVNKNIVLDYINNKPVEGIDITKAQQFKENKEKFNTLITFNDKLLYLIAIKFDSNLFYANGILKLSKNDKKSSKILEDIIGYYNKLVSCYNSDKPNPSDFQITLNSNQIQRIKDSRIGATKMVMMHVVTGQDYKYSMVKETIGLTNTLFDATQIDLKGNGDYSINTNTNTNTNININVMSGGSKLYKLNYDFIEIID